MLSVTVNDRPLPVPAIFEEHILVPMRAAFEAGASIAYDDRRRIVVAVAVAAHPGAQIATMNPPADAAVATAYPTISASLTNARAARANVSLRIDAVVVTALASFDGTTITFMPRKGLTRGKHTVTFSGTTLDGNPFSAQWSFATTLEAPPDAPSGATSSAYDYRFYSTGGSMFYPGSWMHFVLMAPPGGSAMLQLCNLGYQYAFWNGGAGTTYQANVPAPYGYSVPWCQVTAIYTSWNGVQTYVPIPIYVGLYTNPNNPAAWPIREPMHPPQERPLPVTPRRLPPAPSPLPAPKTLPVHAAPLPPRIMPPRPRPRPT